ncbi:hypothetical protein LA03_10765 [Burkholderia gladioli]|nr:hypothetical protein LA03_10765 [Burkholderia gladioli]
MHCLLTHRLFTVQRDTIGFGLHPDVSTQHFFSVRVEPLTALWLCQNRAVGVPLELSKLRSKSTTLQRLTSVSSPSDHKLIGLVDTVDGSNQILMVGRRPDQIFHFRMVNNSFLVRPLEFPNCRENGFSKTMEEKI